MNSHERGIQVIDALICGKDKEALRLLKQGGEIDFSIVNRGDNAIHLAARRGQLPLIRYMNRLGSDLDQRNVHGNVAMHYAAKGGFLELVKYLRDKGAGLNILNEDGESPLHEAVKTQTMDMIEELVDLGMDPNIVNSKTGDTPLHTALRYGAEEAMEGLLIKGANAAVTNYEGQGPEDVANNRAIKGSLRMYATMLLAVSAGYIKAKGFKLNPRDVVNPFKIDRVGVIIESIDIPREFPTGFYCRREMAENSSVPLKKFEDENVYSDVFHIRIFDVSRNCKGKIFLPLYKAPSETEELMIRFIHSSLEARVVDRWDTIEEVHYCLLEVELTPETTCICVVNVRPKREEKTVTAEGATITSELDANFTLEVPPGSFEEDTDLILTVFESQLDDEANYEDATEDKVEDIGKTKATEEQNTNSNTMSIQDESNVAAFVSSNQNEEGTNSMSALQKTYAMSNLNDSPVENLQVLKNAETSDENKEKQSSKEIKSKKRVNRGKTKKKKQNGEKTTTETCLEESRGTKSENESSNKLLLEENSAELLAPADLPDEKSDTSRLQHYAEQKEKDGFGENTVTETEQEAEIEAENERKEEKTVELPQKAYQSDLLTNVYQINISGQQPKKGVKLKIPFCTRVDVTEELAIIGANEETLNDESEETVLEVLSAAPQVVGMNLIFEVSHFSIYVASWKKKASVKEELRELQRQISDARDRRKPAAFFAVVKLVEGRKPVIVVECVMANKSIDHRRKWVSEEGYEEQNPPETGAIMMKPGDTFYVDIEGNASLEDKENAIGRKLQFSQCRSSWQPYQLTLHENIYEEDMAYAYVKIMKKTDKDPEEAARLRIKLTPPPKPPPTPPPTPPPPTPPPSPPLVPEPKIMERPKTAGPQVSRTKPERPKSSVPMSTEERVAEMTNRIGKKEYKPQRSIGDTLKSLFRRHSTQQ